MGFWVLGFVLGFHFSSKSCKMLRGSNSSDEELELPSMICHCEAEVQAMVYCAAEFRFQTEEQTDMSWKVPRKFMGPSGESRKFLPCARLRALAAFADKLDQVEEPRRTEKAFRGATVVVLGGSHAALLEKPGSVSALGDDSFGQLQIPTAPRGVHYVAAAAGTAHTVLLRSREAAYSVRGIHVVSLRCSRF